jgi:hypothetical protein
MESSTPCGETWTKTKALNRNLKDKDCGTQTFLPLSGNGRIEEQPTKYSLANAVGWLRSPDSANGGNDVCSVEDQPPR